MSFRTVVGTITNEDNTPRANLKITFRLNKLSVDLASDEVFPPKSVSVITDNNGEFSQSLWANSGGAIACRYDVQIGPAAGSGNPPKRIVVTPGVGEVDLSDLIAAGDTSTPSSSTVQTAIDLSVATHAAIIASPTILGHVKVGSGLSIDGAGVLSSAGAVSSVFGRSGAVVAAQNDYTFAQLASKPTTLAGYGIVDAQALDTQLSAIAALADAAGYLRNNGAGVFAYQEIDLSGYAPLASPALTGVPTAPTAAAATNTTQLATTAFVRTEVANLVASAPGALDTLDELAAALGDDANFATTVTNALALKAPLLSPSFTTPDLGVATATSINKVALTQPATAATLTIVNNKTLTVNKSLTLEGTDSTVMTFPTTSATIARTDAGQTFTGTQTFGVVNLGGRNQTFTGPTTDDANADVMWRQSTATTKRALVVADAGGNTGSIFQIVRSDGNVMHDFVRGAYTISSQTAVTKFRFNGDAALIQQASDIVIGWSASTSTVTPFDLSLRRNAPANLALGAVDAAAAVAQSLSVQNVVAGTSNTAGATLALIGSLGTSQGVPGRIDLQGGALIAASGTVQQTPVSRLVVGASKVLTNNTVITLVNVTDASNTVAAGILEYSIEVFNGTDLQVEEGIISFHVTNKGGTIANNTVVKSSNQQAMTSGTLTVTFAISAANPALLSVNANSSLTPSTGYPRIVYALKNLTQQAMAVQ